MQGAVPTEVTTEVNQKKKKRNEEKRKAVPFRHL